MAIFNSYVKSPEGIISGGLNQLQTGQPVNGISFLRPIQRFSVSGVRGLESKMRCDNDRHT